MERVHATGVALLGALLVSLLPAIASADERGPDPQAVFNRVRPAYLEQHAHRHSVRYERHYFSTVIDAGRAYARLRPSDPEYGKLAVLTVQLGSALHYNPLTDREAAPWWIREASVWVNGHSKDPTLVREARSLVIRVDAIDGDPETLATYADRDAAALVRAYPHDNDAQLLRAEADWRAWVSTNDSHWRDRALYHAAQVGITAEHLPHAIAHPFSNDLSALAPADEYFGRMNYSLLGVKNAERSIERKLDAGEDPGSQESLALLVADALCDMQKTYPADRDITKMLWDGYSMLTRVATPSTQAAASKIRTLISVEYQDSPESAQLLQSTTATTSGDNSGP